MKTNRGFERYEFTDLYGAKCSFQESSVAEKPAIWLGCDKGTHHLNDCYARMHLDVALAIKIRDLLDVFIKEGS